MSAAPTDPRGRMWSDSDVSYLTANYAARGSQACADHLGRSEMAVRIKAHRMGLRAWPVETVPRETAEVRA